jgi:ABC-type polysaccharide/polyol phosphate export permease
MRSLRKRLARLFHPSQRHLLKALIHASFKVTDQNSIFGIAWSLIMPVFFTLVMYFLFRGRFKTGGYSYPVFIMVGVSTVGFFLNATTAMMTQFPQNRDLILNTLVPREFLFLTAITNALVKYLVELALALVVATFIGTPWWAALPLMIPLLAALCAITIGVGLVLGVLVCVTRDIHYLWVLVSRVLLFATPVFYPLERLSPVTAKLVYWLNPLSPVLVAMRKILIGLSGGPCYRAIGHSLLFGVVVFSIGYAFFLRYENSAVERA